MKGIVIFILIFIMTFFTQCTIGEKENIIGENDAIVSSENPTDVNSIETATSKPSDPTADISMATESNESFISTQKPTEKPTLMPTPTSTIKPTALATARPTLTATARPTEHKHVYESKVTKPSCSSKGYTTFICTECGDTYVGENVEPLGHKYMTTLIKPTCTEKGYTIYKCTGCGKNYKDKYVSALGHKWGEWVIIKEATSSSEGIKEMSCKNCNQVKKASIDKIEMSDYDKKMEVLRLVNVERKKEGLAPLKYYYDGQKAGDTRAKEINQFFSHDRPDGRACFTALDDLNINYCTAGENIAYGYSTPADVVEGWMNSPGHRKNIMSENFEYLIVGVDGVNWVQLFLTLF